MPFIMESTDLGDTAITDVDIPGTAMMDPMDDLFGETANDMNVQIQMPTTLPPPPRLIQRVAEMQSFACST